jgi:hypothetical protein
MLKRAGISIDVDTLRVESMQDGEMGSLLFAPDTTKKRIAREVANSTFKDADGMGVSVSLNVDQNGLPFELDIWKYDFSALIRWPLANHIVDETAPPESP